MRCFDKDVELEKNTENEKGDGERWVFLEDAEMEGKVVDEAIGR